MGDMKAEKNKRKRLPKVPDPKCYDTNRFKPTTGGGRLSPINMDKAKTVVPYPVHIHTENLEIILPNGGKNLKLNSETRNKRERMDLETLIKDLKDKNNATLETIKQSSISSNDSVKPRKPPKPKISASLSLEKSDDDKTFKSISSLPSIKVSPTTMPRMKLESTSQESTIEKISESEEINPYLTSSSDDTVIKKFKVKSEFELSDSELFEMQSEVDSMVVIGANERVRTKSNIKKNFGTQTSFDKSSSIVLKFAESNLLEQIFEYPSEQEMLERETERIARKKKEIEDLIRQCENQLAKSNHKLLSEKETKQILQ